jgi:DNA replication and repair protein RecF
MGLERLRSFNFRNLGDRELGFGAREVFLVGENGQGKTNLLEAVHLLCLGSSFREKRESLMARDPQQPIGLHGTIGGEPTGSTSLSLQVAPGRGKEIRVNDKLLSERRELFSTVLCICFVQDDMLFVNGPPEDRRRFFDQTLILSDLSFLDALRDYRQVLRARNLCLKGGREDLLDVYDGQLAGLGLVLQQRRAALMKEFDAVFSPLVPEIMGASEAVTIRYRPSWESLRTVEEVTARLAACRGKDRALGVTTSGPHRDSCSFLLHGRDYARIASTGQLRLCALALRVAQARFLAERTGRLPILLLDDVLLELDPGRKRAFVSRFPPYEQAFFTFLPDESWQALRTPETLVLTVSQGEFNR